ncbi:MAG TPA: DUF5668 domain-containing protein [Bacillota bacterium]|nr:DUF5668 domain-containing protein [Bacillota bacterium]
MIKRKVGSITLAVGLITVGALLFAQNFMDIPVKDIYKYWPVLLIGLGLEMILYMLLYGRSNTEVKLSIDGLCIVFIIILGIISNGIRFFDVDIPGRHYFRFNGSSLFEGFNYRTEISEKLIKDNISDGYNVKTLKVTNDFGEIKVLPADGNTIRLEADITVKCNDESKAREYARNSVEIIEGEVTELYPKTPYNWVKGDHARAQIDFVVYVPKGISLEARGSFGDIRAEGIEGECRIENKNGEIIASNISGDADIDNSFGDIEVNNIGGKADISNNNGEISADNIGGSAVIENHFGDIEAEKVGGDLKVVNNNGRIYVKEVRGKADLVNAFGDIGINRVDGGITVENKNGRIEAEDVAGNAQIKNAFGDIYYKSASADNGDIYASTKFGSIDCDKPLQIKKEGQDTVAQGRLGTGQYKIELETKNGSITIK